jgi:hypothetical protein
VAGSENGYCHDFLMGSKRRLCCRQQDLQNSMYRQHGNYAKIEGETHMGPYLNIKGEVFLRAFII